MPRATLFLASHTVSIQLSNATQHTPSTDPSVGRPKPGVTLQLVSDRGHGTPVSALVFGVQRRRIERLARSLGGNGVKYERESAVERQKAKEELALGAPAVLVMRTAGGRGHVTLIHRPHLREAFVRLSPHTRQNNKGPRSAFVSPDATKHVDDKDKGVGARAGRGTGVVSNAVRNIGAYRCHFHTLELAARQQTGHSQEVEWTLRVQRGEEPRTLPGRADDTTARLTTARPLSERKIAPHAETDIVGFTDRVHLSQQDSNADKELIQGCRGGIARIERLEPIRSPPRNRNGDGPLGQWVPSPPLGSALLSVRSQKDAAGGGALERSPAPWGLLIG
ncbi:hypothetical protein COCON_G00043750 [Conger conger]|uniref:Uncharacterized protein n=1 Tax=Conger conger TaxID=82655 RepID=A0A9Q1DU70_CONCO|nr:hypothetical protein COCON_G00043750 [Conger conger]